MSPQEIKLTGKLTAIVAAISVIVNLTVAFTTVKLYTAALMNQIADHEARLRSVENCMNTDLSALRSDQSWVVNTLDRHGRQLDTIQQLLMEQR